MALHERFSEYTPQEINDIKNKRCKKCIYKGRYDHFSCCDYILIECRSRGCMPDECEHYKDTKYKSKTKKLNYIEEKKMDNETIKRLEDYIARYTTKHGISKEEALEHLMVKLVLKEYTADGVSDKSTK